MFVHALVGALIGASFSSIFLIIVLNLLIHFLMDIIPHWDGDFTYKQFYKTRKLVMKKSFIILGVINVILTLGLVEFLFFKFDSYLPLFGAFVAVFPDLMKAGYYFGLKNNKLFMDLFVWHLKIQNEIDWKIGLLIQLIISFVCFYFLL